MSMFSAMIATLCVNHSDLREPPSPPPDLSDLAFNERYLYGFPIPQPCIRRFEKDPSFERDPKLYGPHIGPNPDAMTIVLVLVLVLQADRVTGVI
ncbi:hypothetical protein E1B28_011156 [Marasmius oreades]|uniref:Uncharacterized protein n=1 Tax=Marasmius oreades TaxID=181124 RepID=A0A9P7RTJ0_9AGAR|nr:uncharacterized protein E1B28_011156 [Marasmius oreades]KAG7089474.1 hypothetical protein E1B28_011156 [Marasmius oreades]